MAAINDLIAQIQDADLRARIEQEVNKLSKQKKFGLVFEEHLPECTPLYDVPIRKGTKVSLKQGKVNEFYTVLKIDGDKAICKPRDSEETVELVLNELVAIAEFGEPIYPYLKPIDSVCNAPDSDLWHTLIEADNYHALQLLEYLYAGKVDCIYIDPPYNTGARDWKYNNDYVDGADSYRHSKWLSFMQKRLKLAKKLLNPKDSVLIVTIDEKEYLHLGCLLEEMFPEARIQMISDVINPKGVARNGFSRNDEYIFFVMMGEARPARLALDDSWSTSALVSSSSSSNKKKVVPDWTSMMRRGSNSSRTHSPGCYYPIYVNPENHTIEYIGEPIEKDYSRAEEIEGLVQVLPIRTNGDEGCWQVSPTELKHRMSQGRVRVGRETSYGFVINYLPDGAYKDVTSDKWTIEGYAEDGSILAYKKDELNDNLRVAPTQWKISSHNASEKGSSLISKILTDDRFTYPKSLYSEMDAIKFFVAEKKNAIIVDFFAGSGTTLHAVNLINAEDNGSRQCILVTNNEVSNQEAITLYKQGFYPGDEEWEEFGIARYVTWPRTVCSILGIDLKGTPLSGDYGFEEDGYILNEEDAVVSKKTGKPTTKKIYVKSKIQKAPKLAEIKMADGFKTNANYFKLGFLDKTSVALGRQFKEMLPTLWMKAGAIGACPHIDDGDIDMLILPQNRFAVLCDESKFTEFEQQIRNLPEIKTVYLVTDYDAGYRTMIKNLPESVENTYQLYRDYLDNFRINTGRI